MVLFMLGLSCNFVLNLDRKNVAMKWLTCTTAVNEPKVNSSNQLVAMNREIPPVNWFKHEGAV